MCSWHCLREQTHLACAELCCGHTSRSWWDTWHFKHRSQQEPLGLPQLRVELAPALSSSRVHYGNVVGSCISARGDALCLWEGRQTVLLSQLSEGLEG